MFSGVQPPATGTSSSPGRIRADARVFLSGFARLEDSAARVVFNHARKNLKYRDLLVRRDRIAVRNTYPKAGSVSEMLSAPPGMPFGGKCSGAACTPWCSAAVVGSTSTTKSLYHDSRRVPVPKPRGEDQTFVKICVANGSCSAGQCSIQGNIVLVSENSECHRARRDSAGYLKCFKGSLLDSFDARKGRFPCRDRSSPESSTVRSS